jgi:hypothetical protein
LALLLNLLRARSIIAAIRYGEDHAPPFPTPGRAFRGGEVYIFSAPFPRPAMRYPLY